MTTRSRRVWSARHPAAAPAAGSQPDVTVADPVLVGGRAGVTASDADDPAGAGTRVLSGAQPALAEDDVNLQHPTLVRLQNGANVGSAVRKGAAWATGSRVASQVVQFLGVVISARLLVPSDYGNTAVIAPLLAFAGLFANLGMASAVIHARRVTEELLSTAFWTNALAGVGLTGLLALLAVPLSRLFHNPELGPLLLLASILFTINLGIVHLSLLERTLRFKTIAFIETGSTTLAVIAIVVAASLGAGPYSLVWGPIVNMTSTTVCLWSTVRWRPRARPRVKAMREIWAHSRGVTGYNLLTFWSRNTDNLLLAGVVSLSALGNYNRAYTLMKLPIQQMETMMTRVMFPAMSRLRDDRPRLAKAWLRAITVASSLTAPVTLGLAVSAPAMVEVLFGQRWLGMVTVLQLLAVSALPQTLSTTTGGLLRAVGATDTLFRLSIITSSLTVIAIISGLPWGIVGVATALLAISYVEAFICLRQCLRALQLRWRDLRRALLGIWMSCLGLVATGIGVRLVASSSTPAWHVLIAQVLLCSITYIGVLSLVDRRLVTPLVLLVRRGVTRVLSRNNAGTRH